MFNKEIFYVLLILNFSIMICHRCGADLLMKKLNLNNSKVFIEGNRRRLSDEYFPIRVKIDYTLLNTQYNRREISDTNYELFRQELDKMPEYLGNIISVKRETFNKNSLVEAIKKNCIYDQLTISDLNYDISSYDLFVFPRVDKSQVKNNTIAAAGHCVLSGATLRPIVGLIILNDNLNSKKDIEYYIKNSIFHEFFHILGFNTNFFEGRSFNDSNYIYLNSPKMLERAKIHFGCENLKGLRLENQGTKGTIGSHWDARFMQGELMIGEDYSEIVLSDITLAFLEDLGYYQINYYTGGLFRFGKNQGCAFLEKNCINGNGVLFSNEFCAEPSKALCTGSHTSKGSCYIAQYNYIESSFRYFTNPRIGGKIMTDYCPISFYNQKDDNYNYPMNCVYGKKEYNDEVIGSNSICFESSVNLNVNATVCYQIQCDRVNKKFTVFIGNNQIICDGEEKTLEVSSSDTLNCPDYNMVCTSDIWCNNMFDCIDKKSLTDENTFLYVTNKDKLLEKDIYNLNLDDYTKYDLKINNNNHNFMSYNWIVLFSLVFAFI